MAEFAGFWSYVHEDDRNSGGRILSLADRLTEAFSLISAESLRLFVDRELEWGEEWEKRISQALQETTFFIPIVTPSYFQSEACRKELLDFARAARDFGVEQLLLPIYYVKVPDLDQTDPPSDEAMSLVKSRQWIDLRDVRLLDEKDSEHRVVVNALAERLLEVAENLEGPPSGGQPVDGGPTSPLGSVSSPLEVPLQAIDGLDEGEGALDLLAKGEEAMPEWRATIEGIGEVLGTVAALTEESTSELNSLAASGNESFASRLAAANRLASKLEEPADLLVNLGSDYVARALEVDPAVRTFIAFAEEDDDTQKGQDAQDYFRAISEMVLSSRESTTQLAEFARGLEEPARFSRELRKPVRKIQAALRNVIDAQSILDEWYDRVLPLRQMD